MNFQQRRHWRPTPVLLPGKSHGRRSLVGCSPWGCKESDATEQLHFHFSLSRIGEGNVNPFQCSCLENPRDGGAWWAAVYGVSQSRTRLTRFSNSSSSSSFQSAGGNARRARLWEARSASLPCEDTMRTRPGPCRGPAPHFLSWAHSMVVLSDQPTHKEGTAVLPVSAPGRVGLPGRQALQAFWDSGSPRLRISILSPPPCLTPSATSMGQNCPTPRVEDPPSPRSPSSLLALLSPSDV